MDELFSNISQKNRETLMMMLEAATIKFSKKSIVSFVENSVGIVLEGCIQIIKNDYNGNRYVIDEFFENMIFSSISVPAGNDEYEIVAKENSTIILFSFDDVLHYRGSNSRSYTQFLKNLLKFTTDNITKRNERIELLVQKTIRNKLLSYFKLMRNKTNSKILYLSMTFTELAEFLAIDRSAMNRELKHLKEEGFIEIDNKRIKLLYEA